MQKEITKKQEIAIRFYENQKFGTTYGKGLRHSAVFNAAADLRDPQAKYLLDFYSFAHWQHTARSDDQMSVLEVVGERANAETLVSWIVRQDPITKVKLPVIGFCTLDMKTNLCVFFVADGEVGVQFALQLTAKPCRHGAGKNSPTLLATNADLGGW